MELSVMCLSISPPHSQTRLQPHHRRGVRLPSGQRGREDGQTADLGHCWSGAISVTASNIFRNAFQRRIIVKRGGSTELSSPLTWLLDADFNSCLFSADL